MFAGKVLTIFFVAIVVIISVMPITYAATVSNGTHTTHVSYVIANTHKGNNSNNGSISPLVQVPPPGGGGGGGYYTVYVTLYIFDSAGQITVNGQSYASGTTLPLKDTGYSISADVTNTNYHFDAWITDSGLFSNALSVSYSSSTEFYASGSGSLTLVVQSGGTGNNWAGLIEDGSGFNGVSGSITLPSSANYISGTWGAPSEQIVSFWVGMGGYFYVPNQQALWQAGVTIQINSSSSSPWVYAWYEYVCPGNGKLTIAEQPIYGFHVRLGDTVDVSIGYQLKGTEYYGFQEELGTYSFTDYNPSLWTQTSITGSTDLGLFDPYDHANSQTFFASPPTTVEWISEDPSSNRFIMPTFNSAAFSQMSGTMNGNQVYPYIYSPLWSGWVDANNYWWCTGNLHQYLTPYLDNTLINGFHVNYSDWVEFY